MNQYTPPIYLAIIIAFVALFEVYYHRISPGFDAWSSPPERRCRKGPVARSNSC